jgi:hypothetical protein
MSANRDSQTAPIHRGLPVNHSETALRAPRPVRGLGLNHSETVLGAPRPVRGLGVNHSEAVLRAPRPPRGIAMNHSEAVLRATHPQMTTTSPTGARTGDHTQRPGSARRPVRRGWPAGAPTPTLSAARAPVRPPTRPTRRCKLRRAPPAPGERTSRTPLLGKDGQDW